MIFHLLTFHTESPKGSIEHTSRVTLRMLMNAKIMIDSYYCIKLRKKTAKMKHILMHYIL